MLMTAAGTSKPAQVLVLGVGVAGLSAIGTARRLGAQVTGYDIRPETRDEVRSVGAQFLDLPGISSGSGTGGYARALTDEERAAQQEALQERIGDFDIVITTAQVPGRRPPQLVTQEAVKGMKPGSVVVDIAAGPLGGNVEGSPASGSVVLPNGVTLIGAGNLPSAMAPGRLGRLRPQHHRAADPPGQGRGAGDRPDRRDHGRGRGGPRRCPYRRRLQ